MILRSIFAGLVILVAALSYASSPPLLGRQFRPLAPGTKDPDIQDKSLIEKHPGFGYLLFSSGNKRTLCLTEVERSGFHKVIAVADSPLAENESLGSSNSFDSIHCSNSDQSEKNSFYIAVVKNTALKEGQETHPFKAWKVDFSRKALVRQKQLGQIQCEYENQD